MIASLYVNLLVVFLILTHKKLKRKFKITCERNGAQGTNEKAFDTELSSE